MKYAMNRSGVLTAAMLLTALGACGGPSKISDLDSQRGRAELVNVEIGRLVDIYSYKRVDASIGDRRLRTNRRLELVARNVVINSGIESQSLFDAAGQVVPTASYQFLPFDKTVGHEELLILWDNTPGSPEAANFDAARTAATAGLLAVPASYRGQNTQTRPIPIVPRNAAIRLTFSTKLDVTPEFFTTNPSAIQVLEFKGDPNVVAPVDAFRMLSCRVIPDGKSIILDTTILGGESTTSTSPGLPLSADNVTANIRIAIPSRGSVVSTFYVKEDGVDQLNDVDSAGRDSVIRDFRSGNLADGAAGRMAEPEEPMIVTSLAMGITDVDTTNNIVTVNKRQQFVPVRARYPFVDGPVNANGLPLGPTAAPLQRPLRQGDILTQVVQVETQPGFFENVRLRAEILENLEIATTAGTPGLGHPITPEPGDSGQGELEPTVRLRVASVFAGTDSTGTSQRFQANSLVDGKDCVLRALYYEEVPYTNSGTLTDRNWRNLYVRIEPKPSQPAANVQPNSSVAIEFTKPMDLDQVDSTANLLVTSRPVSAETFAQQMTDPKKATTRIVPTRLSDLAGDGTVLRLQPPMGFFHAANQAEAYSVHVRLGAAGVTDLAGQALDIFANAANPQDSWSVDFALASSAAANLVGWHTYAFEADDEDGSLPGSVDIFGQYRRENGRLIGASGVRSGRSADLQNLSAISRIRRGECWDPRNPVLTGTPPAPVPPTGNSVVLPLNPQDQNGVPHTGLLYWNPRMSDSVAPPNVPQVYEYFQTVSQPVGRVIEPLKPQGSRMQMRYIEDDFSLSYRQPSDFGLDVEQLYWSPFNDETVLYDVYDRFTMSLSHARRRPDEFWFLDFSQGEPPICTLACPSMNSGLSNVFADNVLEGTTQVPVFEDKVYKINPNEAFRTSQNVKYVPFPRFDRTYTWRDSRLVTVDASGNVIGLGGALQPGALPPNNDFTANVDSPWIESVPLDNLAAPPVPDPEFFQSGAVSYVLDPADFLGSNQRDHDPIALPLLVDFKVFPDDAANGVASGTNAFQVAMLGPPTYGFPLYGGYYDQAGAGCPGTTPWPHTRVHASGGWDLLNPAVEIRIDPANTLSAQASVVKDAGAVALGGSLATALFTAPSGDGMMNWARADFVRKVSTATLGFIDTLQPQRNRLVDSAGGVLAPDFGIPDLAAINSQLRISDLVVQLDPPQTRQPAGTSVVVEMRGADTFANSTGPDALYNPSFTAPGIVPSDAFDTRGNLLNPNYACEAYRYSTPNTVTAVPRVVATGLTRYVTEDQLALIRNPATSLLPRFLNLRVVMTNNVTVSPSLSPSLRSMSVVYRMVSQ